MSRGPTYEVEDDDVIDGDEVRVGSTSWWLAILEADARRPLWRRALAARGQDMEHDS
jgi:hypothetical protein